MAGDFLRTGFTLVAYFTPSMNCWRRYPSVSPGGSCSDLLYGGFCYMQAGFLREQVCKYMCPYARFQGSCSIRIRWSSPTIRAWRAAWGPAKGCRFPGPWRLWVDCGLCVAVCPTGIDIRKGIQYECIWMWRGIDACDPVMDKVGKPRGLIATPRKMRLKNIFGQGSRGAYPASTRPLYTAILLAIIAASVWSLANPCL